MEREGREIWLKVEVKTGNWGEGEVKRVVKEGLLQGETGAVGRG